MTFFGATRKQGDKSVNDDAFAVFGETHAFLLDGAGNAKGAAKKALSQLRAPLPEMSRIASQLHTSLLGLGFESTFIGVEVRDGILLGLSAGNSTVHCVRGGTLQRVNETTRARLGSPKPEFNAFSVQIQKYDCILLGTDGLTLDHYRLTEIVKRYLIRPQEMAEAILSAQKDTSDDVTVVCKVI